MKTQLIKNARIIDGTGSTAKFADVAIKGDIIQAIGKQLPSTGVDNIFDADGMVLAPGFIDAHSHSDISILAAPEATGKVSQGITSEIIGNCGLSVFPITDCNREHLQDLYSQYNVKLDWNDISGYAKVLSKRRPVLNIASHVGHNTLRSSVAGYETQTLSTEKLRELRLSLSESLKRGALGFSTGLLYVPGKFASNQEISNLLIELSCHRKIHVTHLRSEGDLLLEAVQEILDAHLASNAKRLHISHLKVALENNWNKLDELLSMLEEARVNLSITADRYPYTEGMTQLSVVLPPPYDAMTDSAIKDKLKTCSDYENLIRELRGFPEKRWRGIRLISCSVMDWEPFFGQSILEIANTKGTEPAEICAELMRSDAPSCLAGFKGMKEKNMHKILSQKWVCCGSDESARPTDFSIGRSHPRGFGSMPKFINLLKPEINLEKAIARVSSLPARIFGLNKRGKIAPGFFADLVMFDQNELSDRADFANPHQTASGIRKVWVNGVLAYKAGVEVRKSRPGRFLNIKS